MSNIVLDEKLVRYIAKLSRIRLSDDEVADFKDKLNEVLRYVKVLDEIKPNTTGKSDILQRTVDLSELRSDNILPSLLPDEALSNAPKSEHGYFRVDGALSEPEEA